MSRESASEEQELDDDEMELDSYSSNTASNVRNSELSSSYRIDESDEFFCDKYGRQINKEPRAKVSLSKQKLNDDAKDCTDAETNSQISQASSDDSKSYSQVYSEIYEESVARQKNAESICKFYITNRVQKHFQHVSPENRTKHWVNGIEERNMEDWTTETSDYSENISLPAYQEDNELKTRKGKYSTPIKEPIDHQPTRNLARKGKPCQVSFKEKKLKYSEKTSTDNIVEIKCSDQSHKYYTEPSHIESFTNNRTEKLKFDHCEIYHVKPLEKTKCEALTYRVEKSEHRLKNHQEVITEVVSAFISNFQMKEVYKEKLSARAESKYIDQPESCRNKNKSRSHSKNLKSSIPEISASSARTLNSPMEYTHEKCNANEINKEKVPVSGVEFKHMEDPQSCRSRNEPESHSKNLLTSARKVQAVKNDCLEISYRENIHHGRGLTASSKIENIKSPEYFRNETESDLHFKKQKNQTEDINEGVSSSTQNIMAKRSIAESSPKIPTICVISNQSNCHIQNENNLICDEVYSTDQDEHSSIEKNEDIKGQYNIRNSIRAEHKHMKEPQTWIRTNKSEYLPSESVLSSIEDSQDMGMMEEKNMSNRKETKLFTGRDSWTSRSSYMSDDSVLAGKQHPHSFQKQIVRKSRNSVAFTDQSIATSLTSPEQGSFENIESIGFDDSVKSFKKNTFRSKEAVDNFNSYNSETYEDSSLQDYEHKSIKNLGISEKWNKKKSLRNFQYSKNIEPSKIAHDETVCSETSPYQHEVERSRQRLKKEKGSNKRHKSQNIGTRLVSPYKKETIFQEYETGSTSNFDWENKRTSIRRRSSRSRISTPLKTYRDHACSPIRILNVEQPEEEDEVSVEMPQSGISSKSEIKNEFSQASISSDDKSMQYPTDDELENEKKSTKKLSESENETEIPDIPLTPCSDSKLDISFPNSSYNSYRSSIGSMSNYEPSVRFYRRTHAEDDDESVLMAKDPNDSGPLSYKQHVALLAERALRACTNYYSEDVKQELVKGPYNKVLLHYDPEKYFTAINSQRKLENSLP